jgi:XisH protein
MAAKDRFHNIVKIALEKEGWKITHDPLTLKVDAVEKVFVRGFIQSVIDRAQISLIIYDTEQEIIVKC